MRPGLTAAVAALFVVLLAWQHLHGGVPAHHLLAQESLPAVSNWWGLPALPALTWIALGRIDRRVMSSANASLSTRNALTGFVLALLFGALLSLFFATGKTGLTEAMLPVLALIALAYPIYRAECFLGFVIGMTITFGPILPMLAGSMFDMAGALLFHVPRLLVGQFGLRPPR